MNQYGYYTTNDMRKALAHSNEWLRRCDVSMPAWCFLHFKTNAHRKGLYVWLQYHRDLDEWSIDYGFIQVDDSVKENCDLTMNDLDLDLRCRLSSVYQDMIRGDLAEYHVTEFPALDKLINGIEK